jgi:hypothetical protein
VLGGALDVEIDRAAPADLGIGAGDGVDGRPQVVDQVVGGLLSEALVMIPSR